MPSSRPKTDPASKPKIAGASDAAVLAMFEVLPISAMNRPDLIDELAARFANLTKNDADLAVNTVLDVLTDALVAGQRIEIRGFGSFSIKPRQARIRRNPRNGASVAVPERRVVHFKPGKALRESVDDILLKPRSDAAKKPD